MATNCQSRNNRKKMVVELINATNHSSTQFIYSIGRCLKNAPQPTTSNDKRRILRYSLFYLAFENQCEDDYVTEKLWSALASGVLPVYFGAPNIHDHVPHNSIINVRDFASIPVLAEYLLQVASNRSLYESYHSWRKQPSLPPSFLQKYNFTRTHSICRMC